jgi:DNA-binding MarR family transcriptional regulator
VGDRGQDNVLFGVWLVARRTTRLLDDALRDSGLSADDFAVYSLLTAGGATPGTLAAWLAAPLTTVSSYVKRFEARGHVERTPDPTDARSYRITLTPSGIRAHQQAGSTFLAVLAQIDNRLGCTQPAVRDCLDLLSDAVEAVRPAIARTPRTKPEQTHRDTDR